MKRHVEVDHTRAFAVAREPEKEGGFTVRVFSLPEIVAYGKDEREALAMAEDAIRLAVEGCRARRTCSGRRAPAHPQCHRHPGRMNRRLSSQKDKPKAYPLSFPFTGASPMGHGRQQGSIPTDSAAAIEPPASRFFGQFSALRETFPQLEAVRQSASSLAPDA